MATAHDTAIPDNVPKDRVRQIERPVEDLLRRPLGLVVRSVKNTAAHIIYLYPTKLQNVTAATASVAGRASGTGNDRSHATFNRQSAIDYL